MPTETNIPAVIDGPLNDMKEGLHATRIEAEDILDRLTDLILLAEPQVDEAMSITISTVKDVERARDFMKKGRAMKKGVEDKIKPITDAAHKTHKATVAIKNKLMGLIDPAIDDVQGKLNSYHAEEEEKRVQAAQEAEKEGIIAPPVPKVDGVSVKHKKKPVLVDKLKFIKAATNPNSGVSLDLVTFDMKAIEKLINNGMDLPGWTHTTETATKVR